MAHLTIKVTMNPSFLKNMLATAFEKEKKKKHSSTSVFMMGNKKGSFFWRVTVQRSDERQIYIYIKKDS